MTVYCPITQVGFEVPTSPYAPSKVKSKAFERGFCWCVREKYDRSSGAGKRISRFYKSRGCREAFIFGWESARDAIASMVTPE